MYWVWPTKNIPQLNDPCLFCAMRSSPCCLLLTIQFIHWCFSYLPVPFVFHIPCCHLKLEVCIFLTWGAGWLKLKHIHSVIEMLNLSEYAKIMKSHKKDSHTCTFLAYMYMYFNKPGQYSPSLYFREFHFVYNYHDYSFLLTEIIHIY